MTPTTSAMKRKLLGAAMIAAAAYMLYTLVPERFLPNPNPEPKVKETVTQKLHPAVAKNKKLLIERSADIGIPILITDEFRSAEEQDKLFEQGRTSSGSKVTNAQGGESYHNYGLAIDFALLDGDGSAIWDMEYDGNGNGRSDWMEVVGIAKKLGFEWGGDWASPDYPHLQMSFGLSIRELQRGEEPPVE